EEDLEVMFHMYNLDPEEPIVRLAARVMGEMGMTPDIRPSGGGTDGNVFRLNGISNVVVGMSTNEMHTVDEYVVIPDLVNTARFCQQVIAFGY
ncbi:MAG TPA: M20/M25/M40 family metallo-hydrolase, partial [Dehalococcoidia bacterium]|nr:M20/M25/M40 family metallo-hydrolase [Dehalococcoidia bacterium]